MSSGWTKSHCPELVIKSFSKATSHERCDIDTGVPDHIKDVRCQFDPFKKMLSNLRDLIRIKVTYLWTYLLVLTGVADP